ncbi:putative peptide maturation dehydrogenase [Pseudomonas sp. Hp2]|uniref:putative peptide maturation dehydrogenase n=1 Tax=Pseudomonas sp. Hp2 TaxID=701189 RepID=UPI001125D1D8|nr:putative peptide maturation dehydrogenase [Pseudomonas sp. Hp2]
MLVRRCAIVMVEPREEASFDLGSLLAGGAGLARRMRWMAYAAHLDEAVEIDGEQREALGSISSQEWIEAGALPSELAGRMLDLGLLISDCLDDRFRSRDEAVRTAHWWPLAALAHRHGRWRGLDSVASMEAAGMTDIAGLRRRLGTPPPAVAERVPSERRLRLPHAAHDALDRHWAARSTCRNFDGARALSRETFALMLQRVVMAQASLEREDITFLKKNVASGGGLHPIGTYLLVQRVDGVSPGLYHYHPVDHALEPLQAPPGSLESLARRWLSGQHWFADAPVLVILAARFARSFWKYRQHAKAYRALVLETGHISQALYLSAHDLGLGAFVTAAINEMDVEADLGMDPAQESPIAACGFGWRSQRMQVPEFDPAGKVWMQAAT